MLKKTPVEYAGAVYALESGLVAPGNIPGYGYIVESEWLTKGDTARSSVTNLGKIDCRTYYATGNSACTVNLEGHASFNDSPDNTNNSCRKLFQALFINQQLLGGMNGALEGRIYRYDSEDGKKRNMFYHFASKAHLESWYIKAEHYRNVSGGRDQFDCKLAKDFKTDPEEMHKN